jgi:hypothetical protein
MNKESCNSIVLLINNLYNILLMDNHYFTPIKSTVDKTQIII